MVSAIYTARCGEHMFGSIPVTSGQPHESCVVAEPDELLPTSGHSAQYCHAHMTMHL